MVSLTESNRSHRLRVRLGRGLLAALIALAVITDRAAADSRPRHAIAMHGQPALPADFKHTPYVNPDAPKGGRIVWGVLGTFDSLNPFIVRGIAVQQMRGYVI
jgi:peptide/nickel transport system substrate-binding protein